MFLTAIKENCTKNDPQKFNLNSYNINNLIEVSVKEPLTNTNYIKKKDNGVK